MTQVLPESPASVWWRQRGGSIQVCSRKEEVWFRADICQSLTDPSPPPGATAHPNKLCRRSYKGPPSNNWAGGYASSLYPYPALSSLTGRTIRRLRIRFSIALALKKTLGPGPEKAQQFPLFKRVVLRYNRPADSQHVPDEIRSSCRYVFVAALSLYQQILDDSLLA